MKLKTRKNLLFEILYLTINIVILLLVVLYDVGVININIPSILIIKIEKESMYQTLFSVQASMATLSIAIVSLITGFVNDTVYGISVSGFITNIRPVVLKHKTLIIINLILSLLNYMVTALCLFNVSVVLFVMSLLLTIRLVRESYFVFLGKKHVKSVIYKYVIDCYDSGTIESINEETIRALEINNSLTISDNLHIIKTIFKKEMNKQNVDEIIIENVVDTVKVIFAKMLKCDYKPKLLECITIIYELYDIVNESAHKEYSIKLWEDINYDYFESLQYLSYEQFDRSYICSKLYESLLKYKYTSKNCIKIDTYYTNVYYSICGNKYLTKEEKTKLKLSVYRYAYFLTGQSQYIDYQYDMYEGVIALCKLNKCCIDEGECDILRENFFDNIETDIGQYEYQLVLVTTLLYLYYISFREPLLEHHMYQDNARGILDTNSDSIKYFYHSIDLHKLLESHYLFLYNLVFYWEYSDNMKVKTVIIDKVIIDFFVFTILAKYWDNNVIENEICLIKQFPCNSIYTRYFSDKNFDNFKNDAEIFNSAFADKNHPNDFIEKLEILKEVLNIICKKNTIEEGRAHSISTEQISNLTVRFTELIQKHISDEFNVFKIKDTRYDSLHTMNDKIIFNDVLSYHYFEDEKNCKILDEHIKGAFVTKFLKSILSHINYTKISYKDRDKQEKLINSIISNKIEGSVVIGNRTQFFTEDDELLLYKFTQSMKRIRYPHGNNYYFVLNGNSIVFEFSNIKVIFEDISWDEIMKNTKHTDDGKFEYEIDTNRYIAFTEDEIVEYVTNTQKRLIISADIHMLLLDKLVGCGMNIVFDDKNSNID